MSSGISIGRPLESTGRPVELLYRTSARAEDLAHSVLLIVVNPRHHQDHYYLPTLCMQTSIFSLPCSVNVKSLILLLLGGVEENLWG